MFEDSTFESTGSIHTRSRNWMAATFMLNATILTAMVLLPLFCPQSLPQMALKMMVALPPLLESAPRSVKLPEHAVMIRSEAIAASFLAPRTIPRTTYYAAQPEVLAPFNAATSDLGGNGTAANDGLFAKGSHPVVVKQEHQGAVRVSSMVVEGLLLRKTLPAYPPIAKAAGVEGTVVLAATISRAGEIENLRVISGPALLQQAARDAVREWLYKPYLLNGDPVDVETTVNVIFRLH